MVVFRLFRKFVNWLYIYKIIILAAIGTTVLIGGASYMVMRSLAVVQQPNSTNNKLPSVSNPTTAKIAASNGKTNSNTSSPAASTSSSTPTGAKTASTSTSGSSPVTASTTTSSSGATSSLATPPPSSGTASTVGCFTSPSSCGYPDASNTGPVAGTVFTKVPEQATSGNGWTWDSRGWLSVTGSNITLNGIQTSGGIDVTGNNVIIQNCKVNQNNGMFGVSLRHTTGVTVRNCQIAGTDASAGRLMVAIKSIYGDDVNLQSIANNISYVSTGIQYCQGLIQDNYIHDLGYQSGDHLNGVTSNSGCAQLTVQHNTIFNNFYQTDAVSLFEDFGQQMNALVTNNYLAGGDYAIYGGANAGGTTPTNIQITNNRISDYYYPNGGYYGWLAAWNGTGAGNVCSGNILERFATGQTEALSC